MMPAPTAGRRGPKTVAVLAAAALGLVDGGAHAAGFAASRFGAERGTVLATNPTALYYNPAGLGFTPGTRLLLDGTLALRHASWEHPAAVSDTQPPPGADGANTGTATLTNVFGGPMLGASTPLTDRLVVGASFSVPFGGRARWDENQAFAGHPDFPLAAGGVQRWHGIEGALTFMYFSVGAALRLGRVSVGAAGNLVRSSVKTVQARTPTGFGEPDTAREGRATLDVRGVHGSFALGLMAEVLADRLWLAGSYQAQPGLGPMRLSGKLTTEYQGGASPFPVTLEQALPDVFRAGARYRPSETLELRTAVEFWRWSFLQTQCLGLENQGCAVTPDGKDATPEGATLQNVRRHWNDSVGLRAGASLWLSPTTELLVGAGFETAASPDETLDPALADANNLAGALGVRIELSSSLAAAATYTHLHFLPRDTVGKSRLAEPEAPTKRPDGGGRYRQWIGLFNLGLELMY